VEQWNKHIKNPQNVGVPTVLPVPATGTTRNNAEQSFMQHIALTPVNKLSCCIITTKPLRVATIIKKIGNHRQQKTPTVVGVAK
jgi:hypothetical protein